jgi:hypothetical protein
MDLSLRAPPWFGSFRHDHINIEEEGTQNLLIPSFPIQVRDAKTLEVFHHFECGVQVCKLAICAEIIVVISDEDEVVAFRGDQHVSLHSSRGAEFGTKLLGTTDALVLFQDRFIFVHCIAARSKLEESLPCTFKIPIGPSQHFYFESAAWSSDMTQFGYCSQPGHISIWNLYDPPSSSSYDRPQIKPSAIQELKMPSIGVNFHDDFTSLAFNDRYATCSWGLLILFRCLIAKRVVTCIESHMRVALGTRFVSRSN